MTLLSFALAVAASIATPLVLMLLIPAASRALYVNRMYQLAAELEDHFDRGEVRITPFTEGMLETLYHLGHRPKDASFVVFLQPDPPANTAAQRMEEFVRFASPGELELVDRILTRMARHTARQMMRNSIAWLPLWALWHVARATRIAMRSKIMDAIRRKLNPSPTELVSVFAAPREPAVVCA